MLMCFVKKLICNAGTLLDGGMLVLAMLCSLLEVHFWWFTRDQHNLDL